MATVSSSNIEDNLSFNMEKYIQLFRLFSNSIIVNKNISNKLKK